MWRFFLNVIFFLNAFHAFSQLPDPSILQRLGKGINMGNTFEAPTESAWGNPWKEEYFQIISDQGFSHVRIPIRWETEERSMSTAPFTIAPVFLSRIKEVVDTALKNKLHVIINMHHHDKLFDNPDGEKERFLAQWNQIATYFKDYSDSLLFEVLNEPHGNLTPDKWNLFFGDALTEIRKTNPTRWVLMGTAEYGGLSAVNQLELPDDDKIILSVHYYNPFTFTHQGADWVGPQSIAWLGTRWRDTEDERETVVDEFKEIIKFSTDHTIPLHVGEFGSFSTADIESREKWTTFLARWFEEQHLSWAYWEFNSGFGIYNPETKQFLKPLLDALLHNPLPQPLVLPSTIVYQSNFQNDNDGWSLNNFGTASGSLSRSLNTLKISISNGGSENWHVQLFKNAIPLKKGKLYRISFKISSENNRTAFSYAGKASDPWNAYSSVLSINSVPEIQSHKFTFTMNDPTDLQARVVFDLGKSTTSIVITDIKLEELTDIITEVEEISHAEVSVYPNPVTSNLFIQDNEKFNYVSIYSVSGKLMAYKKKESLSESIDFSLFPTGIYLVKLDGISVTKIIRVIKE